MYRKNVFRIIGESKSLLLLRDVTPMKRATHYLVCFNDMHGANLSRVGT